MEHESHIFLRVNFDHVFLRSCFIKMNSERSLICTQLLGFMIQLGMNLVENETAWPLIKMIFRHNLDDF